MRLLDWLGQRLGYRRRASVSAHMEVGSAAGQRVSADTAMQLSTVWSCVRLISETVATLPLAIYSRDASGGKTPAIAHPIYALLHDAPNADQTAAEFWESVCASLCLWGNAFAEIARQGGRVIALTPLRPDMMQVERTKEGVLRYIHSEFGQKRILAEEDVFHVRGFGVGGELGLSPIAYARHSLGLAMAIDEAAAKLFANGMLASGILTSEGVLKPDQRAQLNRIMETYKASRNAGKLMILEAGLTYEPLQLSPEDSQMLAARSFSVEEICRWFRVPPFMVGHTTKSTSWGTGLEQQMIGFLTFSLRPYLTRIEQSIKRKLITPAERATLFAEFSLEGLLRADSAARAAFYSQMAQNGIYTRNEIRAKENLRSMAGGDQLTVQSNLIPVARLGEGTSNA
jgi:HK97 family phage portal protein